MSAVPQFLKRLESRIAIALARAELAYKSIVALANNTAFTNGGEIGPGTNLNFTSSTFTSKTGRVLVMAAAGVTGGTTATSLESLLKRDSTTIGATINSNSFLTGSLAGMVYNAWIDTVVAGAPHTYTLNIVSSGSSGMNVAATGAAMVIIDLPVVT
jgi:hypothetical protein